MHTEQKLLVDAIRFETANLESDEVKANVLRELNKVDNYLANRVAVFLGFKRLKPDVTYYHGNQTKGCTIMARWLKTIKGLKVGILASSTSVRSLGQAKALAEALKSEGIVVTVIGETLVEGIHKTYAQTHAADFDGIIVTDAATEVFKFRHSPLYPSNRPRLIVLDAFRFGKPIGVLGSAQRLFSQGGLALHTHRRPHDEEVDEEEDRQHWEEHGIFVADEVDDEYLEDFKHGLEVFKFLDRFAEDEDEDEY